jgi:hypothetical protein
LAARIVHCYVLACTVGRPDNHPKEPPTIVFALAINLFASCSPAVSSTRQHDEELKLVPTHLANFDDFDYNVLTNQKWTGLHRGHAHDILVHWLDGRAAKGIDKHMDDLKAMFIWAPDTRVKEHPVKLGQGKWTSVIGVMEGTFTKPLPIAEGNNLAPTGKA